MPTSITSQRTWAHGAVACIDSGSPFGVVVTSAGTKPYQTHVLVFDPNTWMLHEAVQWAADHAWLWRTYTPVSRRDLERAGRLGPSALNECSKTPFTEGIDSQALLSGMLEAYPSAVT